jgi:sugar phosphate isomerase/epimerase
LSVKSGYSYNLGDIATARAHVNGQNHRYVGVCVAGNYQTGEPVDADLAQSNLDLLLGLHPRYDLQHVLAGERTLEEILVWSRTIRGIQPCLDFSHQYARHQGAFNRYEDFLALLGRVSTRLGREALSRLHIHVSGIEFGPGGERRHVPLMKSRFRWRDLLRALREVRASGWVICETPAMEEDALRLQRFYRRIA